MDLNDIELRTDLTDVVSELGKEKPGPKFALKANRVHVHKAKAEAKAARRGIKKLIHPDNARFLLTHLPVGPDDRTHCILRGDFVLCDLIPMIIEARGRCRHLHVATLGLSAANADALAMLRARDLIGGITLVCSHYFAQVDKTTTYRDVMTRLDGLARVIITRAHAKVICLPLETGENFVIEGSANLRSSDNTEQIVILNDAETLAWHASWMEGLES